MIARSPEEREAFLAVQEESARRRRDVTALAVSLWVATLLLALWLLATGRALAALAVVAGTVLAVACVLARAWPEAGTPR